MNEIQNSAPEQVNLYRAEQVRELDRMTIEEFGVAGFTLMTRAGEFAFQQMLTQYPDTTSVCIVCGRGNNAGDGYIVACLAIKNGLSVEVCSVSPVEKLQGDAREAYDSYLAAGGEVRLFESGDGINADIVVDALLGTGLDRPVSGLYAAAIEAINGNSRPVVALDIPSGLNADTGAVMGAAVNADMTVTFIGQKQGLYTGEAAEYCGNVYFSTLDAPAEIYQQSPCSAKLVTQAVFPVRKRAAHKGTYGHVLVIGGEEGYTGALKMSGEAAARTGAGLVSLATRSEHAALLNLGRPELMSHGVTDGEQLVEFLEKATVIAIGPGLGHQEWAVALLDKVLQSGKPIVVDADALNLLAKNPVQRENWILTPHPGEAARLLQCPTAAINQDRFAAVNALQNKYGGICLLKGKGTLVTDGTSVQIANTGNPGMASGGMGDVLTGIIAAMWSQGLTAYEAAGKGAYVHGRAADLAAESGERGLLASDLMPFIRRLVNNQS